MPHGAKIHHVKYVPPAMFVLLSTLSFLAFLIYSYLLTSLFSHKPVLALVTNPPCRLDDFHSCGSVPEGHGNAAQLVVRYLREGCGGTLNRPLIEAVQHAGCQHAPANVIAHVDHKQLQLKSGREWRE